eukprot:tig00021127_g18814.t1
MTSERNVPAVRALLVAARELFGALEEVDMFQREATAPEVLQRAKRAQEQYADAYRKLLAIVKEADAQQRILDSQMDDMSRAELSKLVAHRDALRKECAEKNQQMKAMIDQLQSLSQLLRTHKPP